MSLRKILKDSRIRSYDIECFDDEQDTYLFFIKDDYVSTWEHGNTVTDEKPFKYILSMLKTKGAIVKK
jgi:hypothetical protein